MYFFWRGWLYRPLDLGVSDFPFFLLYCQYLQGSAQAFRSATVVLARWGRFSYRLLVNRLALQVSLDGSSRLGLLAYLGFLLYSWDTFKWRVGQVTNSNNCVVLCRSPHGPSYSICRQEEALLSPMEVEGLEKVAERTLESGSLGWSFQSISYLNKSSGHASISQTKSLFI